MWKKLCNLLKKVVNFGFSSNLVDNSDKITICCRSVCFEKKNDNLFFCVCQLFVVCFTGKNENLAERYFHFCGKWSLFSKMLVSSGDIKFSLKKYLLFLKSVNFW